MKYAKRLLSLLLVFAIALPLISGCGDTASKTEAETSALKTENTVEVTTDPNDRSGYKDSLPEDLDFGGMTIGVLSSASFGGKFIEGPEELSGEIVQDTIYERNEAVSQRLNVKLNIIVSNVSYDGTGNEIKKFVLAGDNTYDYAVAQQFGLITTVVDGIYYNFLNLPYIDLSQPWWCNSYMDEIAIGNDKRFFFFGDYTAHMLYVAMVLFINKTMYENIIGNPDEIYAKALEGNWTMDAMEQLVKSCYSDLNGDGAVTVDDQFGFVTYYASSSTDAFAFATDIHLTERDNNGTLQFTMGTERQIKAAELINKIFWNQGSYVHLQEENITVDMFRGGRALMLGNNTLGSTYVLREMEDEYGILPYPKLDELQENYRTVVHDCASIGVVPINCAHPEQTGAVLEAMNSESWKYVIPAWYETALKIKYVRDNVSAQMIDIIRDSITTEFAYVYASKLDNAGKIFRTLTQKKSNDFASEWAKIQNGAENKLEKLYEAYIVNN
ncbi:MAG: hypothetical protein GX897_03670 [Clostridiales bacterium]|nr:hypothetical protein [Clostridiales bacterium]